MTKEVLTDAYVFKLMGWIIVSLLTIIPSLMMYIWSQNNKNISSKIEQVTASLNMFIDETVEMKDSIGKVNTNVALIHKDVLSLQQRVEKHGSQIDELKKKK